MNQKQRQRLGSAIPGTILSCATLLLAAVDKAQAGVLTYNFTVRDQGRGVGSGFFKFNNSSLTGIATEEIAVSEGRFNTFLTATDSYYGLQGKDYYDLVGATVLFFEGEFLGLQAQGRDSASRATTIPLPPFITLPVPYIIPEGPFDVTYDIFVRWAIGSQRGFGTGRWLPTFSVYRDVFINDKNGRFNARVGFTRIYNNDVDYTLTDTAAEPVPEPVTITGTALALAGLSWLKHKKKMAV
jgi:hypothetical protein